MYKLNGGHRKGEPMFSSKRRGIYETISNISNTMNIYN